MTADLGPVGLSLPVSFTRTSSADEQRAAVRALEAAGVRTVWTNEVIGKDAFTQLGVLLAATGRMAFGTCVANVWARPPQTAHGAASFLAQAYPGRFALGLGVGYPQQAEAVGREYGSPLAAMRSYVAGMDAPTQPPAVDAPYPRLIGANGPKMLALAAEVADGALPAGRPPEHTALARRLLGPDKLLVVGLSAVLDGGRDRARAVVEGWAAQPAFLPGLAELGYPAEVTDELVDALVAHGSPDAVADRIQAHLAAGADHVTVLLPIGTEFGPGVEQLLRLAPAIVRN